MFGGPVPRKVGGRRIWPSHVARPSRDVFRLGVTFSSQTSMRRLLILPMLRTNVDEGHVHAGCIGTHEMSTAHHDVAHASLQ